MEHVEAQLQRLGADGLDEFDPLIARVQKVGLESIERLDAQRDSEGIVRTLLRTHRLPSRNTRRVAA